MAKNTLSSEFRNIDVDQYNEDNYKDDDGEPQSPPIGVEEATIVSSINSGSVVVLTGENYLKKKLLCITYPESSAYVF